MPRVRILVQTRDTIAEAGEGDEAILRHLSSTIERTVYEGGHADQEVKEVLFTNEGALAAHRFVIRQLNDYDFKKPLYIKVGHLPILKVVAIWEVVELLELTTPQHHVQGMLVGYISHRKLSPEEMVAIHKVAYEHRGYSKVWKCLIHHLAYNIIENRYTEQQILELEKVANAFPELKRRVDERAVVLIRRKGKKERKAVTMVYVSEDDEEEEKIEEGWTAVRRGQSKARSR